MARVRSLPIIIFLPSKRSSSTPASGPIVMVGMARASMMPITTGQGEHRDAIKVIANLAYYLTHPGKAVVAILTQQVDEVISKSPRSAKTLEAIPPLEAHSRKD
jgi:hypothetical protein